jgi:hypothetical protein
MHGGHTANINPDFLATNNASEEFEIGNISFYTDLNNNNINREIINKGSF